jgi:copper chaperone CopZ
MTHKAQVIHHIPGRMRVKLPQMKGKSEALAKVKQSVCQMPGVTSVDTNTTTGSVLVNYDPKAFDQFQSSLADHAETQSLFSLKPLELTELDEMADKVEGEAEFLAEHSELARSVVNVCKQLNDEVKRSTRNMVDLKVLVPLALAVYTFTRQDPNLSTPLWVTLGIFSVNSFITLHVHQPPLVVKHQMALDSGQEGPPSRENIARQAKKQS